MRSLSPKWSTEFCCDLQWLKINVTFSKKAIYIYRHLIDLYFDFFTYLPKHSISRYPAFLLNGYYRIFEAKDTDINIRAHKIWALSNLNNEALIKKCLRRSMHKLKLSASSMNLQWFGRHRTSKGFRKYLEYKSVHFWAI